MMEGPSAYRSQEGKRESVSVVSLAKANLPKRISNGMTHFGRTCTIKTPQNSKMSDETKMRMTAAVVAVKMIAATVTVKKVKSNLLSLRQRTTISKTKQKNCKTEKIIIVLMIKVKKSKRARAKMKVKRRKRKIRKKIRRRRNHRSDSVRIESFYQDQ